MRDRVQHALGCLANRHPMPAGANGVQAALEQFNRVDCCAPSASTARTARCLAVDYEAHQTKRAAALQYDPPATGISNTRWNGIASHNLKRGDRFRWKQRRDPWPVSIESVVEGSTVSPVFAKSPSTRHERGLNRVSEEPAVQPHAVPLRCGAWQTAPSSPAQSG